jgi:hypothetical protein
MIASKNPHNISLSELQNYIKIGEYYYHYKHQDSKGILDYAYQIIGTAIHTENEEILVLYKPLYQSDYLETQKTECFARPLSMFLEKIEIDDKVMPRFRLITDHTLIKEIQAINQNI